MRLDRILQAMLPHDEQFFTLFEESAKNIMLASDAMMNLREARGEEIVRIVEQIKKIEHDGDSITHRIFNELNGTFVTPFDPEDIHVLASALDDIVDNIDGSAGRFLLYKIKECPPEMARLIECLHSSVEELQRGIYYLRKLTKPNELRNVIERVNELENVADNIFERAIANLLKTSKTRLKSSNSRKSMWCWRPRPIVVKTRRTCSSPS
jgi:predicted phosphate transport protein (TIGR00153 family)